MHMARKIGLLMIFWIGVCLSAGLAQDEIPDLSRVQIISTRVAGNVYMLEATGDVAGNIAVSAGPDGILMVDTQYAQLGPLIQAELKKISKGNVRYVINTHSHQDHTHGNLFFGKSALIIAHANAFPHLLHMPGYAQPTITFSQELSIYFNGEEIKVIHFPPGHTDNDVVVFFTKSKVVHVGDLWNSGESSFPTVDLEGGGDVRGMLHNVKHLIGIIPEDVKIIPGHYELSNLDGLKVTRDMLRETITLVKKKISAGMSLAQIKKEGLPQKYDSWGTGYTDAESWIGNIYYGLKKSTRSGKN